MAIHRKQRWPVINDIKMQVVTAGESCLHDLRKGLILPTPDLVAIAPLTEDELKSLGVSAQELGPFGGYDGMSSVHYDAKFFEPNLCITLLEKVVMEARKGTKKCAAYRAFDRYKTVIQPREIYEVARSYHDLETFDLQMKTYEEQRIRLNDLNERMQRLPMNLASRVKKGKLPKDMVKEIKEMAKAQEKVLELGDEKHCKDTIRDREKLTSFLQGAKLYLTQAPTETERVHGAISHFLDLVTERALVDFRQPPTREEQLNLGPMLCQDLWTIASRLGIFVRMEADGPLITRRGVSLLDTLRAI